MKISRNEIERINRELELLTDSADKGDCEAQYNLGYKYLSGIKGIKEDRTLGAKYMKMAKNQGHPSAKLFIRNQLTKAPKKRREIWEE